MHSSDDVSRKLFCYEKSRMIIAAFVPERQSVEANSPTIKSHSVSAIRPLSMGHLKHFINGECHQLFTLPAIRIPHVSLPIH